MGDLPEVTQLSHGRPRFLGIPMFRDTLCSAFLSVNTNFCSSSLPGWGGAPRYSESCGGNGFWWIPSCGSCCCCFPSSIQPSSLGSQPSIFLWRSLPFPLRRDMGSAALPASSQHRHVIVTWSFEVTVVGSVQAPDKVEPASTSLEIFFCNFWEKEFSFPEGVAYLVQ